MAFYNNRSLALDRGPKGGPRRPLGPVGHRLAGVLRGTGDPGREGANEAEDGAETPAEQEALRFALVWRGYDRTAVDEYVTALEGELAALDRELTDLRGGSPAKQEVASELQRIGEQTSAVLMAAHEQREEIVRGAQAEAERCIAEANAAANARTAACEARLRELSAQTDGVRAERDRLLDDVRKISAALAAVADSD